MKTIDRIAKLMIDGLEQPKKEIIDDKIETVYAGYFQTIDIEPVNGDRAFCVTGDMGDKYSYYVEIKQVEL